MASKVETPVELNGQLGRYTYWVYPINTTFKDEPGNYIYARRNSAGEWEYVYIGESSSLSQRLASTDVERTVGATHILAHLNPDERARKNEEKDLIKTLVPRLVLSSKSNRP